MITTQQRFDAFTSSVTEAMSMPFEYGKNDCLLFVARAVKRLTGVDHARAFLPYDTRRATKLLRRAGGIIPFVSQFLGEPDEVLQLKLCDPCVIEVDDVQIAGLWSAKHVALVADLGTLRVIEAKYIVASWSID